MTKPLTLEYTQSQSFLLHRAYFLVGLLGVIMLAFIVNHYFNAKRLNELTSPLWTAVREAKLETTAVQHEITDLLNGEIDPAMDSILLYLEQSIWHLTNLLQSHQKSRAVWIFEKELDFSSPLAAIDRSMMALKRLFESRHRHADTPAAIDGKARQFDAIFATLQLQLDQIESDIVRLKNEDQIRERIAHFVMGFFCVVMITLVAYQMHRHERYRKQNYETLNRTNLQLTSQIEERERAEVALKESERLFHTIFDTSPDAVILSRSDDRVIVDVNAGFSELTGYGKSDVVGKTPSDIALFKRSEHDDGLMMALDSGQSVRNAEIQVCTKTGDVRTVLLSAATVEFGQTRLLVSVSRDINDLKTTENELRRSEEKFRGLFESASDLIHILDLEGRILQSNTAAINILGLPMANLYHRQISDFVDDTSKPYFNTMMEQMARNSPFNTVCAITAPGGGRIVADCSAFPVRDTLGEIKFVVIFQKDITERKQVEHKLRISNEFMRISGGHRKIGPLLDQFTAAIIAHTKCSESAIFLVDSDNPVNGTAMPTTAIMPCGTDGGPANRCICSRVLNDPTGADGPWFTDFGSYFFDPDQRDGIAVKEDVARFGGSRCCLSKFESLALVPIRVGSQTLGMIQIGDVRPGLLSRSMVDLMETAAMHVGTAIRRLRAEIGLETAYFELEKRVVERTQELSTLNQELQVEIEERRQAEDSLQKNSNMLQTVIDGISDALILVDRNMKIRMLNRIARQNHHITASDDALDKLCRITIGNRNDCEDCEIPHAVERGIPYTFERSRGTNGERLERVSIYPVKEADDVAGGAIIRVSDITEEKRFEQQLIQSEKMASLGILVSSIGHEINNPNNFITFNIPILREYLEMLIRISDQYAETQEDFELFHMSYSEFRDDVFKLVDNIEHGASRISNFVSNLRDFSQSRRSQAKEWLELAEVFEKVLSICRSQIKKRVQNFTIDIPPNHPRVYADPYALEQVLFNLIVNSIQAMDKVESTIRVLVTTGNDWRETTIISVSDNGSGIDEDDLGKLFNPFYTTKSASEGTGLGLYISHNLVKHLGGRIDVKSRKGEGSTFTIFLPGKERRSKTRA